MNQLKKVAVKLIESPNKMYFSKKQPKSYNSTRYNSKKAEQQISLVLSHRPQQQTYESLRNSNQKVLKLRGNSKNTGIKMISQQRKLSNNDKSVKHQRKFSNADMTQSKKYLINSNDSTASIHFSKDIDTGKKSNNSTTFTNTMTLKIAGSYSKANKQNISIVDSSKIQRKKSSQKGLQLTKKSSNQTSYFMQGYANSQNHHVKPKSARAERPLAENYLLLNLKDAPSSKPKQIQNRKKLSIDFDAFCKMNSKQQHERKNQAIDNFYSQRNSICNFYQTGVPSRQTSKQKISISINQKYSSIKLDKKQSDQPKRLEINEMYNSIMLKSKEKLNQKISKQSKKCSVGNVSYFDKVQITNRQPLKSHRINNYIEQSSLMQSNHKRILSILQKSSGSKFFQQSENDKIQTSRNFTNSQAYKIISDLQKQQKKTLNEIIRYSPNSFSYNHVVGKGGFGKVWKVHCKRTNGVYALKQMSKALIISKKSVPSVMNEQQLLRDLKNPFLVNMVQSFQTRQNLYLLMDYLSGGDLRHHLAVKKYFTQDQTKFIVLCILLGLKYLHQNQIIHRDIKPQNIVLDDKGYARITDLGVARKWRQNNSADTSGTPGYMAPEVLCRQNHSYEVDYFAVGVITYEMMLRKRPYYGKSRKQIRDQVLAKQVQIKRQQIPDGWSLEGADFINRMIQRKPSNRLGSNGIEQIFGHPWLKNISLQKIQQKRIQCPYVPQRISKGQNEYLNYTSSEDTQIKQLIAQNQIMLRQKDVQNLFQGYQHY